MNDVRITGKIVGKHAEVQRSSGAIDKIPLNKELPNGETVTLLGKVATRNVVGSDGKNHKKMFVNVVDWNTCDCNNSHKNIVQFDGVLVKKDLLRKTPFGKIIMDTVFAINDESSKSQYPSVIVWGDTARFIDGLPIGTTLRLQGRFQSREYTKGEEIHTAYEISVSTVEEM